MRLLLALCLCACGARTDLVGLDSDGSPRDAATIRDAGVRDAFAAPDVSFDPPDCGEEFSIGEVRAQVDAIHARVAIGLDGNLYTAREIDDTWFALSLDPCLRERWSTRVETGERSPRGMDVSVAPDGTVWLVGQSGLQQWQFSSTGVPLGGLPAMERRRDTWLGIGREGPVVSVFESSEEKWLLVPGEDELRLPTPSSFVWDGECGVYDDVPSCWNIGFRLDPLDRAWLEGRPRLIDGTLRNIVPPAFDGSRLWTIEYGISTYDLVAIEVRNGDRDVRESLMRTTSGQTELLLGPPVIAEGGSIIVYRHGSGVPGALEAYSRRGAQQWSLAAPRARGTGPAGGALFDHEATHLVARDGIVYLGMGSSVYAVDVNDGGLIWRLDSMADFNQPAVNLHPNGDLYVLDSDATLYAIVTGSPGLAPSPWPIPAGNAQLSLSR